MGVGEYLLLPPIRLAGASTQQGPRPSFCPWGGQRHPGAPHWPLLASVSHSLPGGRVGSVLPPTLALESERWTRVPRIGGRARRSGDGPAAPPTPDAARAVLPNNILVLSGDTCNSSISDFVEEGSCQPPDLPAGPNQPRVQARLRPLVDVHGPHVCRSALGPRTPLWPPSRQGRSPQPRASHWAGGSGGLTPHPSPALGQEGGPALGEPGRGRVRTLWETWDLSVRTRVRGRGQEERLHCSWLAHPRGVAPWVGGKEVGPQLGSGGGSSNGQAVTSQRAPWHARAFSGPQFPRLHCNI